MGTVLQDFAGRWIVLMDDIRRADHSIIDREDLVKEIINGILASIGAKASYEKEASLPNGIKRLNLEST